MQKAAELFALHGIAVQKWRKWTVLQLSGFYGRMKYFLISWKDLCAINCGKMAFYRLLPDFLQYF